MKRKIKCGFVFLYLLFLGVMGCHVPAAERALKTDTLAGQLVIFHAGSLSFPVKALCDSFRTIHPNVTFLSEAAGSKECARKISDLHKPCDVMLSADYSVIDQLLIPEFAKWNIRFATNEMTIVYRPESKYADQITKDNWFDILLKEDVAFARSNPDNDPCGVRAVLTAKLAEIYYKKTGLAGRILAKDRQYIRPKETDLLALLESGTIDYIFLYRSVAMQHHLNYLVLPDEINLKNNTLDSVYGRVSVQTLGKKPGAYITEKGEAMVYGLTIPDNAPNQALAEVFVDFVLSEQGQKIMEANGQPSVIPSYSSTFNEIPGALKKYALEQK